MQAQSIAGGSRWQARPTPATAVLWLGAALLVIPTLYDVALGPWSLDEGSYGVIVLAIGIWLVARRWGAMQAAGTPGVQWLGWTVFAGALVIHILARVVARVPTEATALYIAGLAALYLYVGWPGLRQAVFPLFYLALAVPISPLIIGRATGPLRYAITHAVVELLSSAGLMVASEGLTLYIDSYKIAVAEACSGINSLISLTAIGLFYVYARGRRLGLVSLPVVLGAIIVCAIIGNFARVLIIVLLTHFFGEAVAQGPLHEGAGLITFVVALSAVMLLDALVLNRVLETGDFND